MNTHITLEIPLVMSSLPDSTELRKPLLCYKHFKRFKIPCLVPQVLLAENIFAKQISLLYILVENFLLPGNMQKDAATNLIKAPHTLVVP